MIWNEIEESKHNFNSWWDYAFSDSCRLNHKSGHKNWFIYEKVGRVHDQSYSNSNNLIKIDIINSKSESSSQKEASEWDSRIDTNESDFKMANDSSWKLSRDDRKLQYYLKLFKKREEQELKKKNKMARKQNNDLPKKKCGRKRKGEKREPVKCPPIVTKIEVLKIELIKDDDDSFLFDEFKDEFTNLNSKTNSVQNNFEGILPMHTNSKITIEDIVNKVNREMGPPPKRMSSSNRKLSNCNTEYSMNSSVVKSLDNSNSNKFNSTKNYDIQINSSNLNKTAKELFVKDWLRRTKLAQTQFREEISKRNSANDLKFGNKQPNNQYIPFEHPKQHLDLQSNTSFLQIQIQNTWSWDSEDSIMKREDKDSEIQSQNTTHFAENEEAQYCPLSPLIGGMKMFDDEPDFWNLKRREIKRLFKIEKWYRYSNSS